MKQHIGRTFLQLTRHPGCNSDQRAGKPPPPVAWANDRGAAVIELPGAAGVELPACRFKDLVDRRASLRAYAPVPLAMAELSFLLWCTQGVKKLVPGQATYRTVPSAGARHAFETLLLVNRVSDLTPGLYRYLAPDHHLIGLEAQPDLAAALAASCQRQDFIAASAVTFIWVAVPYRMTWRYGERGYRYLFLDAGHVCQNLYLAAEAVGAGACAVAAFDDQALNNLLGLDGTDKFVIYLASVGKRSPVARRR